MDRQIPRIKLIRWKKCLTQKELAGMAGLPIWKISKWENGKRKPTLLEATLVQDALKDELSVLNPLELAQIKKITNSECPKNFTIT